MLSGEPSSPPPRLGNGHRVGRKVPGAQAAAGGIGAAVGIGGVGLDAESMGHDFPKRLQLIAVAESLREGCVVLSRTLPWALTEKCCQARTRMPVIKYVHFPLPSVALNIWYPIRSRIPNNGTPMQ